MRGAAVDSVGGEIRLQRARAYQLPIITVTHLTESKYTFASVLGGLADSELRRLGGRNCLCEVWRGYLHFVALVRDMNNVLCKRRRIRE